MNCSALDPAEHAASLIDTCHGNAEEALALAHLNVDFAHGEEQHYWDRVAIAIQQRMPSGLTAIINTRVAEPMKVVCAWCGKTLREGPIAPVSHGICAPCQVRFFGFTRAGCA